MAAKCECDLYGPGACPTCSVDWQQRREETMLIPSRPQPFTGDEDERLANRQSHRWGAFDGQIQCAYCDCKPFHESAEWPCGVNPPRIPIEEEQ